MLVPLLIHFLIAGYRCPCLFNTSSIKLAKQRLLPQEHKKGGKDSHLTEDPAKGVCCSESQKEKQPLRTLHALYSEH